MEFEDDDKYTVLTVDGLGSLRLLPAADAGAMSYPTPTVSEWLKRHWYIVFIICVLLIGCVIATVMSIGRWSERRLQRKEREEKDKRDVSGMMRAMTYTVNSFRPPTRNHSSRGTPRSEPSDSARDGFV